MTDPNEQSPSTAALIFDAIEASQRERGVTPNLAYEDAQKAAGAVGAERQEYAELNGRLWTWDEARGGYTHSSDPNVYETVDLLSQHKGPLQAWWPGVGDETVHTDHPAPRSSAAHGIMQPMPGLGVSMAEATQGVAYLQAALQKMASEPGLLPRLLAAYYGAIPRPETIRLTLGQAQKVNYEMHPNSLRLEYGMSLRVFDRPVEWVEDEADSILGADRG